MITEAQLEPLCIDPGSWLDPINEAMYRFRINNFKRTAMFLAQCAMESGRFGTLEENLNYSAAGLLKVWPNRFSASEAEYYARRPQAIANRAYANRGGNRDEASGDGWRYRGRGPLQVTFRSNYFSCGVDCALPLILEPERLAGPQGAFGAAWYWWRSGCNEVADEDDFDGVSGLVNRGDRTKVALHLEERQLWFVKAQNALREE
jgi:putative chitinase